MADVRRLLIVLIAAGLLAVACSSADPDELPFAAEIDDTTTSNADETSGAATTDDVEADGDGDDDERGSDYLFAQDQLHTFELTLSDDDLAFLDADPTAEQYVGGTSRLRWSNSRCPPDAAKSMGP